MHFKDSIGGTVRTLRSLSTIKNTISDKNNAEINNQVQQKGIGWIKRAEQFAFLFCNEKVQTTRP
jgi:hypothetical protein